MYSVVSCLRFAMITALGVDVLSYGLLHAPGSFRGPATLLVMLGYLMTLYGIVVWFPALFVVDPDLRWPLAWFGGLIGIYVMGAVSAPLLSRPAHHAKPMPVWALGVEAFVVMGIITIFVLSFRQLMRDGLSSFPE